MKIENFFKIGSFTAFWSFFFNRGYDLLQYERSIVAMLLIPSIATPQKNTDTYTYTHKYIHIYIYIYICTRVNERERERERERDQISLGYLIWLRHKSLKSHFSMKSILSSLYRKTVNGRTLKSFFSLGLLCHVFFPPVYLFYFILSSFFFLTYRKLNNPIQPSC